MHVLFNVLFVIAVACVVRRAAETYGLATAWSAGAALSAAGTITSAVLLRTTRTGRVDIRNRLAAIAFLPRLRRSTGRRLSAVTADAIVGWWLLCGLAVIGADSEHPWHPAILAQIVAWFVSLHATVRLFGISAGYPAASAARRRLRQIALLILSMAIAGAVLYAGDRPKTALLVTIIFWGPPALLYGLFVLAMVLFCRKARWN